MDTISLALFIGFLFLAGPYLFAAMLNNKRRRDTEELGKRLQQQTARMDVLQKELRDLQKRNAELRQSIHAGGQAETAQVATHPPLSQPPVPPQPAQEKTAFPTPPRISQPVVPPAAAPPRASVPPEPQKPFEPVAKAKPDMPAPPLKQAAPPIAAPVKPPIAARVQPPVSTAAFRQPAPPAPAKPAPAKSSRKFSATLEETVGTNWLPKLGITILFFGLVFWIATQWALIPPLGRIAMFYAFGGGLLALGIRAEKSERYRLLGRAMIGGGWATLFFTTYAMHHVQAARVIESLTLDMALMLIVAAVMVWHTLKYNSQTVTGLTFLLGFSAITISHESFYSMAAGVILALGLAVIVLRRGWYELEIFGILASYLNHLLWLQPVIGPMQGNNTAFPGYAASVTIVVMYWVIFRATYVLRRIADQKQESVSSVAALLNSFLMLGIMKYQSVHPELAFYALLALGAVEIALGQLPILKKRRTAFLILSTLGSCLLIGAVPFKYTGNSLTIFWLIGAQAFLLAGIFSKEVLFRRMGALTAMLVAIYSVVIQGMPFMSNLLTSSGQRRINSQHSLLFAVIALVFYADSHVVRRRWPEMFTAEFDQSSFSALSFLGGISAVIAVYMYVPQAWAAVALAAAMLALAVIGNRFKINELTIQAHLFTALSVADVFLSNANSTAMLCLVPLRFITFALVAGLLYGASRFVRLSDAPSSRMGELYTWAASSLVAMLAWYQFHDSRTAVAWMAFALALATLAQHFKLRHFWLQAHVLSFASVLAALAINMQDTALHHGITGRLISVAIVCAILYAMAKVADVSDFVNGKVAPNTVLTISQIHTWAATGLLALLIRQEARDMMEPVYWMALALALALAARQLKRVELLWQAHALSAIAFLSVTAGFFNGSHRGSVLQLATVATVAAAIYALAWLSATAGLATPIRIAHAQTWAASLLLTWLMWYQLPPVSVAIAWALFGLLIFEAGWKRDSFSLRAQGYVAFTASFVRIFFVNINLQQVPGEWFGPGIYTTLPLAFIYFFVYWEMQSRPDTGAGFADDRRLKVESLLAYLGSSTLAAILRFTINPDWVVAAWAGLVFTLLAVAQWSRKDIFSQQAMLLLVAVAFRTVTNNLMTNTSSSRFLVVGTTVLLLAFALLPAFTLRDRFKPANAGTGRLEAIMRRPEQALFFTATSLMTALLFVLMRSGMMTLAWGFEGIAIFVFALRVGERSFRLTGLGLLALCVAKIIFYDVWNIDQPSDRALTLIGVGAILLSVGFLYSKYREKLREYL